MALAVLLLTIGAARAHAQPVNQTFGYTGGEQTLVVPAGVASVHVSAVGGRGGEAFTGGGAGGAAAGVEGDLSVTPGETLYVEVGGNGQSELEGGGGGFNGGAGGGPIPFGAGGGGGATDVRTASSAAGLSPDPRLLVAGGGGGGGGFGVLCLAAGGAGGAAGEAGEDGHCGDDGGHPGTQTEGGQPGVNGCGPGEEGRLGAGGAGGGDGLFGNFCAGSTGGGGGGGLYGGGGGCGASQNAGGGGGGGSSLVPAGGSLRTAAPSEQPFVQISYTQTLPERPVVTGVTPSAGHEAGGERVSIAGSNLAEATAVEFGSTPATSFTVGSASSITAIAPAGSAGTVDVTVINAGGTSEVSADDRYTYVAPGHGPAITAVSPRKGPAAGGTSVTISGTSFDGVTAVDFGSVQAASYVVNSPTSITAVSPASTTGLVEVAVTTPNGESGVSIKDRYRFGRPTVTAVAPASGPRAGGTAITVSGSGFIEGAERTRFRIGMEFARGVACSSTSTCTMLTPASVRAGAFDVLAKVATTSSAPNPPADQFRYE
ncbi:MAG TPA: IPT/TIG domain-containing protein [Solirubrobacteraceae bacterium]|nr:IPT/TIG domain-containing protein [Solirubrobacteraceae bacterium]